MAAGEGAARCESFLKLVAIAHGGRRGAAHGENRHPRQTRLDGLRAPSTTRPARAAGRRGLSRQHCADSPTGGRFDCAAPECGRPHGYRHGGDRVVPHRRSCACPRVGAKLDGQNASAGRWRTRSADASERQAVDERSAALIYYGRETGTGACWASSRRGWWSASSARVCARPHPEDGLGRDPAGAFRHSTLLQPWKPMPRTLCPFRGHQYAAGGDARSRAHRRIPPALQCLRRRAPVSRGFPGRDGCWTPWSSWATWRTPPSRKFWRWQPFGHGNPRCRGRLDWRWPASRVMKEKHLR